MVIIYLAVADYLLSRCSFIDKNWDEEIVLTSDNIELISNQLEELKVK